MCPLPQLSEGEIAYYTAFFRLPHTVWRAGGLRDCEITKL